MLFCIPGPYNAVIAAIPQLSEWYLWPLINGHDKLHSNDHEPELTAHYQSPVPVLAIMQLYLFIRLGKLWKPAVS